MKWSILILLLVGTYSFAQRTAVSGRVIENTTGEPIPFASVFFQDSKIGTQTDLDGNYSLESYYATDSLVVRASGFASETVKVVKDQAQIINFRLDPLTQEIDEVTIVAPDKTPSTILHERVVRNKPINNKEKLGAYEYESYNKIQLDLNNLTDKFEERKIVKSLDVVMNYLDTLDGGTYLPLLLTESVSDFYYRTHPTKKKEVVKASRISGIQNVEVNQFLGEMYQDINVYENYIGIFDKSFISPISNFAMSFYKFYMEDSAFIDNQWCYKLRFIPKRKGDLTFTGEMWIHDTTYAVKQWTADVSGDANINYVNGFYLEQEFDQVQDEVWMLTLDRLIVDLKVTKNSKVLGFYGRKLTSRKNFVINTPYEPDFYQASENVVVLDSADQRSEEYWEKHRHYPLNLQEKNIEVMIDSLNQVPLFNAFKTLTYLATTGFYQIGKIEIGNLKSLMSYNRIEGYRNQIQLRTSNDFSRRIEFFGKLAYGYGDEVFKYGGAIRYNVTPKKRGMLRMFYDYDLTQLGLGENAVEIDAALGAFFRTKPLDQLTFVEKYGFTFEKDLGKNFILSTGSQWKELESMGSANYRIPDGPNSFNTIRKIATFETFFKVRYAKNEEFLSGAFDRLSLGSKYPIISLTGTLGIKGVLESDYEYQKLELDIEHSPRLGILGKLNYSIYGGYVFGTAAYPFLKVHEGSQTYWFQSQAHNRIDFFEFISDKYVGVQLEHHFNGLFFDRIPLVRKLKWRLVASARSVYGDISDRQLETMLLPDVTRSFGNTPYVESSIGIENIFKVLRFDLVWRMTHLTPEISPLSIRGKFEIRF
ncbi:MAG: DUF5686 family protein [Brumimicrobium sp.]|nr:DUF5686 family protein [Brumimicrobium sp.]